MLGTIDTINLKINNNIKRVAQNIYSQLWCYPYLEQIERALIILYYEVGCSAYNITNDWASELLKIKVIDKNFYILFDDLDLKRAVCINNLEVIERWED